MKRLIVNADDFGSTRDVNLGIIESHRRGIVTATTLMANGAEFHHAVLLAKDNPDLDVGVHLVLVGERALSRPERALPATLKALIATLVTGGLNVEIELDAQIRRVLEAGIRPNHMDTHKHTHILPGVARIVAGLARKYGIAWVRRPLVGPWTRRILSRHGCRMTDHFEGYSLTGKLTTPALVRAIGGLRDGLTEFMCHPGFLQQDLAQARTRLKESRVREVEALTSAEAKAALLKAGVRTTRYRDLTF